jgi:hypothetical protein
MTYGIVCLTTLQLVLDALDTVRLRRLFLRVRRLLIGLGIIVGFGLILLRWWNGIRIVLGFLL